MELYSIDKLDRKDQAKLRQLCEKFASNYYGQKPEVIIRSPGRVNLIGDHIDYHGFSVLPMAIANSVYMCCSFQFVSKSSSTTRSSGRETITLLNSNSDNFTRWTGENSLTYGKNLDKSHRWQNYFLCAYHGVLAEDILGILPEKICDHSKTLNSDSGDEEIKMKKLPKLNVYIDSDLPHASGLSSSSALVCASAILTKLLLLYVSDENSLKTMDKIEIDPTKLAESCSKYEHLIGTHGGGMDQAVIMTAQEGYAKFVKFVPKLNCENIRLPASTIWLVSHCGQDYPKAATSGYNTRVLETKLAACLIVKTLASDEDIANDESIKLDSTITLRRVKEKIFPNETIEQIIEIIREQVFNDQDEFCESEVAEKLGISTEELATRFNTGSNRPKSQQDQPSKLKLLSRCEHVFEEAERVERFRSICDTTTDIVQLGQLMTHSHYSLRDKYECSHPALDRLVSVALEAGALGARLTGAGWGGCVVTLVEASKCDTVMERLREVSKFTFQTEPQSGSRVIKMN